MMNQMDNVVFPAESKEANTAIIQMQPGTPPTPPDYDKLWMRMPEGISDTPPGLEYLGVIDHIQIKQIKELAEIVLGWETNNKYVILNGNGQQVYYAFEETGCCMRQCCIAQRGFLIHVVDNFNKEVMRITRPFLYCAGCCWCAVPGSCCSYQLQVEAPPGNVIGTVQQRCSCCSNAFIVLDQEKTPILDLEGPCCCLMCCRCCGCLDKVFPVKTISGEEIGEVRKTWAGILQETFTDADNFGVSFPMNMAIQTKATLIGATFLIDFMNFES